MASVLHVTDETFESQVLQAGGPVLLDVWAEWCGPCKAMSPLLDQLAEEYDGKLTIAKLDMDDHEDLVEELGVRSLPTLMFYQGGNCAARRSGAATKDEIKNLIDDNLT